MDSPFVDGVDFHYAAGLQPVEEESQSESLNEGGEMPLAATYRKAARTDIHRIVEFQLAMARETEQLNLHYQTCLDGVTAVFNEPSLGQYYVGVSGAVACSALITYEWSDWRNGRVWWLQSVYVVPELRRQGVYAGLYAWIRSLAEADDRVHGIRLYVDRRNAVAQEAYTRLGMNGEHYSVFEWMKAGTQGQSLSS